MLRYPSEVKWKARLSSEDVAKGVDYRSYRGK